LGINIALGIIACIFPYSFLCPVFVGVMVFNLLISVFIPILLYGIVNSFQLLFQHVTDLEESISSLDPFSHPVFKDLKKEIGEDAEIIHKIIYPRKYSIYNCIIILIPLSFMIINIFFVVSMPVKYIGVLIASVFCFWFYYISVYIEYSDIVILTQNHVITIIDSYTRSGSCYSINKITHVNVTPYYFNEGAHIEIYSDEKDIPNRITPHHIASYAVYSEEELNTILQHLDIDDDGIYQTHLLSKTPHRIYTGFIVVPIITIMILFYVGIRLRIFPLAVKIVLMVAPTFWIIFMIFLCLYCRNQTEYQRKQKIVEDENNIILDTNN